MEVSLTSHIDFMQFFYMYKCICLRQERPEMDDFKRKKIGSQGKYLEKFCI